MSLDTHVPQFVHNQIQTYRYWYELQPFTAYDPELSTGEETIFAIRNIPADVGSHLAIMSHVAASQTEHVYLRMDGPVAVQSQYTKAFPSGLMPIMNGANDGLRSNTHLALKWNNNTGATVKPAQVNYAGALKRITTADKVLRGLPLDSTDKTLQKKYQIHNQGLRPITINEMLDRVWRRSIITEHVWSWTGTVGTSPTDVPVFTVPSGRVFVLHSLAGSMPSGSVGNMVMVSLDRDTQKNHVEVFVDNAPGLHQPFPMWVTARDSFQIAYQAQTSTDNVALRLAWYEVDITGLLSVVLGQTNPADLKGEERELYDRLRAGVVA